MKTMILSAFMLLTTITNAQETKKQARVKLGISGTMFVAGSLINIAKIYTKEPVYETYSNPDTYLSQKKQYDKTQKNLSVISTTLYGIGGVALLTIKIDF